jgi:hypothetical protein
MYSFTIRVLVDMNHNVVACARVALLYVYQFYKYYLVGSRKWGEYYV